MRHKIKWWGVLRVLLLVAFIGMVMVRPKDILEGMGIGMLCGVVCVVAAELYDPS